MDIVKRLQRHANGRGAIRGQDIQVLVDQALLTEAVAEIERLRNALAWIARRDDPGNPPSAMLNDAYIPEYAVRQIAHDVLCCARAALEQNKPETRISEQASEQPVNLYEWLSQPIDK